MSLLALFIFMIRSIVIGQLLIASRFLCTPDTFWFLYVFSVRCLSFRLAGMKLKLTGLFFFCQNTYFYLFIYLVPHTRQTEHKKQGKQKCWLIQLILAISIY